MNNKKIFLIELHEIIQRYSRISESLTNPTNENLWDEFQLDDQEIEALKNCHFTNESLSAIEKIVRDTLLGAFHDSFSLMDGVSDPEVAEDLDEWFGLTLKERNEDDEDEDFLHDEIYEKYWDWIELKK